MHAYSHRGWAHWQRVRQHFGLEKPLTNCSCARGGIRTSGLWISSLMLYQLSHPTSWAWQDCRLIFRGCMVLFVLVVNECDTNNGGCSDSCRNTQGSYFCECPEGYTLYTQNGTMGFIIPAAETGLRFSDTYYIDHTCVRKWEDFRLASAKGRPAILMSQGRPFDPTFLYLLACSSA